MTEKRGRGRPPFPRDEFLQGLYGDSGGPRQIEVDITVLAFQLGVKPPLVKKMIHELHEQEKLSARQLTSRDYVLDLP